MNLEIDPACGRVPPFWEKTLVPARAAGMAVGQVRTIQSQLMKLHLHRLADLDGAPRFLLAADDVRRVPLSDGVYVGGPAPEVLKRFHLLWREIHLGALTLKTPQERKALVASIAPRLPQGRCDCRAHLRDYMTKNPPDYSSESAFFFWTYLLHDSINERKGMRGPSLEQATDFWCSQIS